MLATGARFRSRVLPNPIRGVDLKHGDIYLFMSGKWVPHPWGGPLYQKNFQTYNTMESCRDEIHAGPPYQSGGPFTHIKVVQPPFEVKGFGSYDTGGVPWFQTGIGNYPVKYVGGFSNPQFLGVPYPNSIFENSETLLATNYLLPSLANWSSQAYKKTKPVLERGDVLVSIAESRDIPRMLRSTSETFASSWRSIQRAHRAFGSHTNRISPQMLPKAAAEDFLNLEFGWKPFVKDISKLIDTFQHAGRHFDRIKRENGQWVRRRRTLLEGEPTYTRVDGNYGQRCSPITGWLANGYMFRDLPRWEIGRIDSTHVTTVGSFKYYRPEFDYTLGDTHSSKLAGIGRHLTLYGARVSPSNVYQAMPWSWLIDWFSNAGEVIDGYSDYIVDGMVAKYLYLMHHTVTTERLTQVLPFKTGDVTLTWDRVIEVKRREEANSPYGFSLSGTALSLRQMAILAAIGLSGKFPSISP